MKLRSIINKMIMLSVFILAGWLLARSLYFGSFVGIVCAIIAITAWTLFLYKLSTLQAEEKEDELVEDY